MEYIRIANEGDLLTVYKEIRINIIRVLNKYCTKDYIEDGSECLDLFALYDVPSVNVEIRKYEGLYDTLLAKKGIAEHRQRLSCASLLKGERV